MLEQPRLVLLSIVLIAIAVPAQVTHYWVDAVNGSDANPGTRAQPFQTFTKGATISNRDAVIHVLPGVYGPATTGDFWDATAAQGVAVTLTDFVNVTIAGTDRATCVIDFNGAAGQWGFVQVSGINTDGVEISDLTFINAGTTPWGNGAIAVNNAPGKRVNIHSCLFQDTNSAIILWGGYDCAVHDNVFVGTGNSGVAVRIRTQYYSASSGDRTAVYHNTFYDVGHGISFDQAGAQQWVCNNIVVDSDRAFPDSSIPPTAVFENNLSFNNNSNFSFVAPPISNISVDPLLVNPAGGDFRLQPTSPCIEAGYMGALPYRANDHYDGARVSDHDGDRQAVPDIGAHELSTTQLVVTGWAPGQTATFAVSAQQLGVFGGVLLVGVLPASLVQQPYGLIGVDPTALIAAPAVPVPGSLQLSVPNLPNLLGLTAYVQAFSVRSVGAAFAFEPSGRADLLLY